MSFEARPRFDMWNVLHIPPRVLHILLHPSAFSLTERLSCRLCAVVKPLPLYDNGTLKRGDKGDYIYKTFGALGVHSLQELGSTLLAKRFPSFARMMYVALRTKRSLLRTRAN